LDAFKWVRERVVHLDCHPAQAFFARRRIWAIRAERRSPPWASAARRRVLCDAI